MIEDFVRPKTKKQIRQFFGLVGYYRKSIPGFAQYSFHLTEAVTAPGHVIWNCMFDEEFCFLMNELLVIPSLTVLVPSDFYILQTDVCTTGLGAVLEMV